MRTYSPKEITRLLVTWSDGDEAALAELTPLVYEELHRLAHRYMQRERAGHTLQTTALVNEAYLQLIEWRQVRWQNRSEFPTVTTPLLLFSINRMPEKKKPKTDVASLTFT